jgi:hypothetical protein
MFKILVCGDRRWSNREKIAQQLRILKSTLISVVDGWQVGSFVVIHGAAKGADIIGGEEARRLGFEVEEYPADWSFGRAAGPIRNQVMLEEGKPNLVLAFHSNIEESKGTKDMVKRARAAGIPTEIIK